MVCKVAAFQTRKMIADGLFISKLSYLISVWGGCEGYLARSLQVIQNRVARVVTKKPWSTPVKLLLSECGWLSVRQLAMYHTVVLVFKVLKTGTPSYIRASSSGCDQTKQKCSKAGTSIQKFQVQSSTWLQSPSSKYQRSNKSTHIQETSKTMDYGDYSSWLNSEVKLFLGEVYHLLHIFRWKLT